MQIKSIIISYSNTKPKEFIFSETNNLISSNGKNTRGKTSLIRFLIWGLGFNVALTNHFKPMYSETLITLKKSPILSINRKGNKIVLTFVDKKHQFILPNDENQVHKLVFPEIPSKILPQLLGFIYFDQDGGYKAWNRNTVTQRLGNDRSYKISIESLLAILGKIDYESYFNMQSSLEKVKKETTSFTNLLDSLHLSQLNSSDLRNSVQKNILDLNDDISKKELELSQIKEKRSIYSSSLRDQKNFNRLLKKLSIKIKNGKNIIDVTNENIIQDKHLNTRLTEFEKYYRYQENTLSRELSVLKEKRDVLIATSPNNEDVSTLFTSENNFKRLTNLLSVSGISLEDTKAATATISIASRDNKIQFLNKIKNTSAYSGIWNIIVSLSSKVGLSSSINHRNNRLLATKVSESGARRSLTVIVYRLGILKYLHDVYNAQLPLIFDSPASSEMDTDNLDILLTMITTQFSNFQIFIATNQETEISFSKKIIILNGVVDTKNQ
ncbi:hypothetical protein [Levilactobacillus namurensis]|uniref:hypothetical protein n=1 Tax=Levilactobacillus namurensis TaxID=380393 RepID=UPI001D457235|nr:hypothetical protein [Levilactobacillus namurensis]HJE45253.1 hypothetical protein [Levilactobacillus namurensis]